jgi:hypothetical protein
MISGFKYYIWFASFKLTLTATKSISKNHEMFYSKNVKNAVTWKNMGEKGEK